ncbi:unnamed protein product [Linum trigynum]|uniref:Sodium channel modifier 1 n=1 Tax=Linum trigynum TaxID=586398 RepID=A0AAV2EUH9_9ROSI
MSVFGGDSWGREAQYRKRKVDDLLTENLHGFSYKKLPSGKFACLVCPHNPVLDSPLMLSMHSKGSRHVAAEAKLKEKEPKTRDEKNKRLPASASSSAVSSTKLAISSKTVRSPAVIGPLKEQAGKAASELISLHKNIISVQNKSVNKNCHLSSVGATASSRNNGDGCSFTWTQGFPKQQQSNFPVYRERELKFTEAGWKRDGHGRWYRDENVEFDSDEEDPNISLAAFTS